MGFQGNATVIDLLVKSPLLLLFLVTAIGYPLGRIKIAGASLGVAAVLFVGLAIGAIDPKLTLPTVIFELGLVMFMYTIGIASGPGFVASLRRKGLRDNGFVLAILIMAAAFTLIAGRLLHLNATVAAGLFAGQLTNTPALAGVIETVARNAPADQVKQLTAEPAIGYSVAYPMGVLGMILTLYFSARIWRIDQIAEAKRVHDIPTGIEPLVNQTVEVTQPSAVGIPLSQVSGERNWHVSFARRKHGETLSLVTGETQLELGDHVSLVGTAEDIQAVVARLGRPLDQSLMVDRSDYDFRRVFVSNSNILGRRLRELDFNQRFSALVTRVRRGDIDILATGDTRLEPGDRVRVLAPPDRMPAVSKFFGDSYRALSEIDITSFGLGIALGMLLGMVPIPLPGGGRFTLGLAGGPLIVGLILGTLGRTGPIVWYLPYSANLTIRQLGLIMLLASIGLRSGYTFRTTFGASGGLSLFLAGAFITITVALTTVIVGYKVLKIPFGLLSGMVGGVGTQPATLGFARDQADNDLPNVGYASVFPLATIAKIILAQVILLLMR